MVSQNEQGAPIRITTIDKWAEAEGSRVDYIKGDLESFEFPVIQGARETIRRYKPKMAFTMYHPGNNWSEIVGYLRALVPEYQFRIKGLSFNDSEARPVMLHVWCDRS